jgi:UDP-N-acetylmuramoylalanine--D-glutamate ligase
MCLEKAISDLHGRRVTVMGLGRFGGGEGAVRFLAAHGARVTVTDLASASELADSLKQLDGVPVETFRLGRHDDRDFRDAELVVVNPAVPSDNRFLEAARRGGAQLTSEMNLFWRFNRGRVVGVTGSNGKSTTAAMIHSILRAAGIRSWLGGNIGRSLLPEVGRIERDDWCVLELSSFQLEDLDRLHVSPEIAVVTNFSPNHLDRHRTLDAYRHAKQTILRWQSPAQSAVLNSSDDDVRQWPTRGRRAFFGTADTTEDGVFVTDGRIIGRNNQQVVELPLETWLNLPGSHNLQNAQAAAAAAAVVGVPVSAIQAGLEKYQPLSHRLQFVAEVDNRRFYNDSLATTAESVAAALESFTAPVVLLAGGYDKQVDLRPLADTISGRVKAVALMGQTGEKLYQLLADNNSHLEMSCCPSFDEAFRWAVAQSSPGDVVLLSPGCASYDWFCNFAERGARFVELVRQPARFPPGRG